MRAIVDIAGELGIKDAIIPYGNFAAKVQTDGILPPRAKGRLILVTAISPTPHGEGKTVVSIGLSMALSKMGFRAVACVRQPSLGPVFGVKGGGAGGGRTTVEPMQQINMRFTGDIDAIGAAHNLVAAMVDNHIFQGNELGIDPQSVVWRRAMDMNDRALRHITVARGDKNGVARESGFVITAASEVMAVLCLSQGYADLRKRLSDMIVAYANDKKVVRASDLRCAGAAGALLRDAMLPNLAQTAEGTPALIHGGPFGNIAHGTCSLVSIGLGLGLAEYVVVEAGFGTDLGAEKFVDIVARVGGLQVDAAVVVATVRALRYHGGKVGDSDAADPAAVKRGLANLAKHIENVKTFGLRCVVAINRFSGDTEEEIRIVLDFCQKEDLPCAASTAFAVGSEGSMELARMVTEIASKGSSCAPIYPLEMTTREKISMVATKIYGAKGVTYSDEATIDLDRLKELRLDQRPICMAKTQLSLSDDPAKVGMPTDFSVKVRRIEPAGGAGFNIVFLGDIVTMPGLPKRPAAEKIELTDAGTITGVY